MAQKLGELFCVIVQEEKKIRTDAVAKITDLLKSEFGG